MANRPKDQLPAKLFSLWLKNKEKGAEQDRKLADNEHSAPAICKRAVIQKAGWEATLHLLPQVATRHPQCRFLVLSQEVRQEAGSFMPTRL